MKIRQTLMVGAVVAAAAAPAGAADLLERYEAAAETIGSKMYDYYVAKFPELKGTRPDIAWNDDFRQAGQCLLDEYADRQGDAYAAKMVDRAEQAAAMSIDNGDDLQSMLALQMPDKISMADVKAVDQKCGMSKLGRERAEQSGFLQKFSELSASGSTTP